MNAAEITDKLGLHSLRHRNWYIQATCATQRGRALRGTGLAVQSAPEPEMSCHPLSSLSLPPSTLALLSCGKRAPVV